MTTSDTSTVLMIADRFGVSVVILLIIFVGFWKAGPRVAAFLTALTDEQKTMTKTLSTLIEKGNENHILTVSRIDSMGAHVETQLGLMEARMRDHSTSLVGGVTRDVRDSVERTGEHAALTALQVADAVGRRPTNPDLQAVSFDRQTPTPAPFVRPLPPRPPSQPGAREGSRPTWEHVRKP